MWYSDVSTYYRKILVLRSRMGRHCEVSPPQDVALKAMVRLVTRPPLGHVSMKSYPLEK